MPSEYTIHEDVEHGTLRFRYFTSNESWTVPYPKSDETMIKLQTVAILCKMFDCNSMDTLAALEKTVGL